MTIASAHWDIVGDIHGQYEKLVTLLDVLGYEAKGRHYAHPAGRKALFVGDFIDRGLRVRDTLHLVRAMIEAGEAVALMGNHEFNAVCYHTPDGAGGHLRSHGERHEHQHRTTLSEFAGREAEWQDWLAWIKGLPM